MANLLRICKATANYRTIQVDGVLKTPNTCSRHFSHASMPRIFDIPAHGRFKNIKPEFESPSKYETLTT